LLIASMYVPVSVNLNNSFNQRNGAVCQINDIGYICI